MRNLTLLTDFYELTMMNGYFLHGMEKKKAVFDLFFREGNINFGVAAGLEQAIDYIKNLHFAADDIAYLREQKVFDERFLKALSTFKFSGDIYAVREGEIVFPQEPLLTVVAPIFEAQLIETALLNIINHQTLIATKSMIITQEANGAVMEFGLRRAQGPDAGIYGTRASIIGGCVSTSNVLAGQMFDIKVSGTHAHSWVMSFPSEIDAFRAYAKTYPDNCLLLVDTYDSLKSGVPNAIKVFNELVAIGKKPVGIRLDSGDLAYLSKKARAMLDQAGHHNVKIFASGDIDEHVLASLKLQGAKIDVYGIGTKLITADPKPALGGVYKLAAMEEGGVMVPKIKLSDTQIKTTNPGFKRVLRIYEEDGMAGADLICLADETLDTTKPLTIFHPTETWKQMTFEKYTVRDITVKIFENGKCIYTPPTLKEVALYAKKSRAEFWEEYTRLLNPSDYKVDLSAKLHALKTTLMKG